MERQRNGVQDNSCGQRCSLCYQFFSWGKKKVNYKALKRPKLSLSFLANVSTHTSKFLIVHEKWELHNGRNDKSWPTAPRSAAATSSSPSRARPGNWIHCIVWGHGHNWNFFGQKWGRATYVLLIIRILAVLNIRVSLVLVCLLIIFVILRSTYVELASEVKWPRKNKTDAVLTSRSSSSSSPPLAASCWWEIHNQWHFKIISKYMVQQKKLYTPSK